MAQVKTVQLICDGDGCTESYSADYIDLDSYPAQRRKARLEGWDCRPGNIDYCPECAGRNKITYE